MSTIEELVSLGFERQWVETALELTNYNHDIAIEWLLSDEFKRAKEQYDKMKRETAPPVAENQPPAQDRADEEDAYAEHSHGSVEIEYDERVEEQERNFASPRTSLIKLRESQARDDAAAIEQARGELAVEMDDEKDQVEDADVDVDVGVAIVEDEDGRESTDEKWQCNICHTWNEMSAEQCSRCRTPRPSDDAWTCDVCSFMNENEDSICQMCLSVRPANVEASPKRIVSTEKTWLCDSCSYLNPESSKLCRLCGYVRGTQVTPAAGIGGAGDSLLPPQGAADAGAADADDDDDDVDKLLALDLSAGVENAGADNTSVVSDRESRILSALSQMEHIGGASSQPKSPPMLGSRVSELSSRNVVGQVADAGDGNDDEDLPFKDPSWSAAFDTNEDEKDREQERQDADKPKEESAVSMDDFAALSGDRGGDEDDFFFRFGFDDAPPSQAQQIVESTKEVVVAQNAHKADGRIGDQQRRSGGQGGQVMVERRKKKPKRDVQEVLDDEFPEPPSHEVFVDSRANGAAAMSPIESETSPAYAVNAREVEPEAEPEPDRAAAGVGRGVVKKKKEKVKVKLRVGSTVDVYSSSSQEWVEGRIDRIKGDLLCVVYGKNMKWLRKTSRQLRLKPEIVKHAREESRRVNAIGVLAQEEKRQQQPESRPRPQPQSQPQQQSHPQPQSRPHSQSQSRRQRPQAQPKPQEGDHQDRQGERRKVIPRTTDAVIDDRMEPSAASAPPVAMNGEADFDMGMGMGMNYPAMVEPSAVPASAVSMAPAEMGMGMGMGMVPSAPMALLPSGPDDNYVPPPPPPGSPPEYRIVQKKKLTEPRPDEFDYEVTFTEAVLGLELYPDREGKNCIVGRCISSTAINHVDPGSLIIQVNGMWVAGGNYDMIRDAVKQAARAPPLTISFRVKVSDVNHPDRSSRQFQPNQRGFLKIKVVAALQLRKRGSYASVTVGAAKLTTQSVSADEHPEWNETLTFKNFRPEAGKNATVGVWQHNRLLKDSLIGDAEFQLPVEFDTLKRDTIELQDSRGLAGVIVINSILISRTNTVKHVRRF